MANTIPCPRCEGNGLVPSFPYKIRCDSCNGRGFEWNPMDWKAAFFKYAYLVGGYEGVDFLYEHDWSEYEWDEIAKGLEELYRGKS